MDDWTKGITIVLLFFAFFSGIGMGSCDIDNKLISRVDCNKMIELNTR